MIRPMLISESTDLFIWQLESWNETSVQQICNSVTQYSRPTHYCNRIARLPRAETLFFRSRIQTVLLTYLNDNLETITSTLALTEP